MMSASHHTINIRPFTWLDRWVQILGMLFACKQVALATKNGEFDVYIEVHKNSLIPLESFCF
jgi:hypothetical protein